jgi:hypothetical protein
LSFRNEYEATTVIVPVNGLKVLISISDPWDFVTENGSVARGVVIGFTNGAGRRAAELKIQLDAPLREGLLVANEVFARLRYLNETFAIFLSRKMLTCGFSNVSGDDWERQSPETRIAFLGTLLLA